MKKVSQILTSRLKHHNLEKIATSALVCQAASEISEGKFMPLSFRTDTLTLMVENPSASAQLRFESPQIIDQVNQKLGKRLVRKVRLVINSK